MVGASRRGNAALSIHGLLEFVRELFRRLPGSTLAKSPRTRGGEAIARHPRFAHSRLSARQPFAVGPWPFEYTT